jgi:GntR family transcriptional regulator
LADILYLAVVEEIKKAIVSGHLSPRDMLKSESEMMKEYGVSRMTLRKSLSLLSNQGYIYSVPGKGNFVKKPDTDVYQFRFNRYDNLLSKVDRIKLLSVTVNTASDDVMDNLLLQENGRVVRVERLVYSDDQPVALEVVNTQYIPNTPVVEDRINFANYAYNLDKKLAFGEETFGLTKELVIKVVKAGEDICMRLSIAPGEDVFEISERIMKKDDHSPLTYSLFYIRKEYFMLTAKTPEEDASKKIF